MPRTKLRQSQISRSKLIDDSLPLAGYDDLDTLEKDLNYLRSVVKQLKGSSDYDTPLTKTLVELTTILENVSFEDATLTGNSTSDNPPISDYSKRIATTKFVTDKVAEQLSAAGADARYIHLQNIPSTIWTITHNLGKNPSVTIIDSSNKVVVGNVEYLNQNEVMATFSSAFSGKAYCN